MVVYTHPDRGICRVRDTQTGRYHSGQNLEAIARRLYGWTARVRRPASMRGRQSVTVTWVSLDGYTNTARWEIQS